MKVTLNDVDQRVGADFLLGQIISPLTGVIVFDIPLGCTEMFNKQLRT